MSLFYGWWWYNPLALVSLMIAYIIGMLVMILGSYYIAPRIAGKLSGKLSLKASMAVLGLIIIAGGIAGILLITGFILAALGVQGDVSLGASIILGIVLFILFLNGVTYLISPWLINLMYRARKDEYLQRIVNEVSEKAGFRKPPKAVVVEGPPNAFAYGNFLAGRWVAVSSEMLRITSEDELKAVVGHELGHHKHSDNAIMLFMGMIPSVLYYLGLILIQSSFYRAGLSSRRDRGNGGIVFLLAGVVAVALSFLIQILVLAFSRLREYYADAHGALVAGVRNMQRSLAKLHIYYNYNKYAKTIVSESKIKALFIYAFTEAYANPYYPAYIPRPPGDMRNVDVDDVIEELRREKTGPEEFFSTHPPIPKRIRFLDQLSEKPIRA
ncbi:zinc metalloprotease HtpX [Thermogladius sp. 4427co]|uniref:zinc metalloprotease HtpX n=1 Tax=Thermogladius sp. 4427co TaxID=3450718 RepID=UPI003F79C46A